MIFVINLVMGYVFDDIFLIINFWFMRLNCIMVTINKSRDYKTEAFTMTVVYYCLETSGTHL